MINKLALKNMLKYKKRTIVTILAITLCSIMMFLFIFLFSTYRQTLWKEAMYQKGSQHVIVRKYAYSDLEKYRQSSAIDHIYPALISNFYMTYDHGLYIDNVNSYLYKVDKDYLNTLKLTKGRLPENSKEIVISNAQCLSISNHLEIKENDYQVVGCVDSANYYTYYEFENTDIVDYLVSYKEIKDIRNQTEDIFHVTNLEKIADYNDDLLKFYSASTATKDYYFSAFQSVIVLIGSTILGLFSLFVIYNSYTIAIVERKKMYGILTTIGTEKKDIVFSICIEAFIEFIIGFLLGFLASYGIMKMGIQYINIHFFRDYQIYIYPMFFLISMIVLFVFVLLASIMPAIEASYIDPIKAIQSNADIKAKKIKEHKFIRKIFGIEGVIAYQNNKRNKRKIGITTFSIVVSFTIFVILSIFVNMLQVEFSHNYISGQNYDYEITYKYDNLDDFLKHLDSKYIEAKNVVRKKTLAIKPISKDQYQEKVPGEMIKRLEDNGFNTWEWVKPKINIHVYNFLDSYSDDVITELVFINDVVYYSENAYYKGELLKPDHIQFELCHYIFDHENKTTNFENCTVLKDIKTISKKPIGIHRQSDIVYNLIVPKDVYESLPKEYSGFDISDDLEGKNEYRVYLNVSDFTKFEEDLSELKKDYDFIVVNQRKEDINETFEIRFYTFLGTGILIFIAAFALINIYNSINISMTLRKKDFKMLESLGMDKASFRKMIRCESLFFSLKSILWGILLSGSFYLWLRYIFGELFVLEKIASQDSIFQFPMPLKYMLIAIIVLIIVVYIAMRVSTRYKEEDIVISLGEE